METKIIEQINCINEWTDASSTRLASCVDGRENAFRNRYVEEKANDGKTDARVRVKIQPYQTRTHMYI